MINGVNANTILVFANPNAKAANRKNFPLPANFVKVTPTLVDSVPGLTEREKEILANIRERVGGSVKFNLAEHTGSDGLTFVQTGFNGRNSPFMVTKGMLRDMAADNNVHDKHMKQIQVLVHAQNSR